MAFVTQSKLEELAAQYNITTDKASKLLKSKGHQIEGVNVIEDKPRYIKKQLNNYQINQITKNKTKEESAQTLTQLNSAGYTAYDNGSILGWVGNKVRKLRTIGQNIGEGIAGAALGSAQQAFDIVGSAAKATDIINPVSITQKLMGDNTSTFGETLKQSASDISGMYKDIAPEGTETSQEVGKVGLSILGTATGANLIKAPAFLQSSAVQGLMSQYPKISKALGFLGKSAAYTTGYEALKEQDLPTKEELAVGAVLDSLTLGAGKVFNAIIPKTLKGKAIKAGVGQKVVGEIEGLSQSGVKFAQDLLEQAKKNNDSFTKTGQFIDSPYNLAAKSVDDVANNLNVVKNKLGSQIDQLTEQLKGKGYVAMNEIADSTEQLLKKNNVIFNPDGTLDWSKSRWRDSIEEVKPLENIWKEAKGVVSPTGITSAVTKQARDFKADIDYLNTTLAQSYKTGKFSIIDTELQQIKDIYRKTLDQLNTPLGKVMRDYADIADATSIVFKQAGKESEKTVDVVRRLFSNDKTNTQGRILFEKVLEQAKKYNIQNADQLLEKLSMAKAADDVYNAVKEGAGITMTQAGQMIQSPQRGIMATGLDKIQETLFGTAPDAMKQLLNAVQQGQSLDAIPWYRELPNSLKMLFRTVVQGEVTGEDSSGELSPQENISQ